MRGGGVARWLRDFPRNAQPRAATVVSSPGRDQFRNGAAAVSSGAGITLHPDTATPATIAAAVRQILVEDSFRDAAHAIAAQIRTMPAPAEVATRLERLP